MKCPSCQHDSTKVLDSRVTDRQNSIRRRRQCEECDYRFTTFEKVETSTLLVAKKDGRTQPYDREKLEKAILIACGKRPISVTLIREKISELEEAWTVQKEVASTTIGTDIVEMLRQIDDIAFIRFASVYQAFQDVESFKQALESVG